ncbi:hypothetical protein L873DRAFT_1903030 [Choiromyces venosus 120613-1]|uniref:Uncharacterized protein n=1 Tax=Choiromyces venosus 120613-1 TaxID=1336337 RepID=A0A3N4JP44_9PEZI|nr:hypothetical protein L873DRAFT_1903030 [Choiromyces venosus 120613-1]
MLLTRLAWPHRLSDIYLQFGWKPEYIYDCWHYLLSFDTMYSVAIKEKNAPLESCWGFIDRTLRPIACPIYDQESIESRMSEILDTYAYAPNGSALQIYGDQVYGINDHLISPLAGATIFSTLDFTCTQHSLVSPIGLQYLIAVLLYNAHICLHHPQIPQYFAREQGIHFSPNLDIPELSIPPSLEEYFHYYNHS